MGYTITTVGYNKFKVAGWGNRAITMQAVMRRAEQEQVCFAALDGQKIYFTGGGYARVPEVPEIDAYIQEQTGASIIALIEKAHHCTYQDDRYDRVYSMLHFLESYHKSGYTHRNAILAIGVIGYHLAMGE